MSGMSSSLVHRENVYAEDRKTSGHRADERGDLVSYEYSFSGPDLRQVKDVCVSLGGKRVLDHLSFNIRDVHRPGMQQGQVVALLGPSGAGKTTLFRRIAGLDKVDSGTILIGPNGLPTEAGLVGVVMQQYRLRNNRSVLGNMLVAGQQAGLSAKAAQAKAKSLLDTFDLYDRAYDWPAALSGGQRQRVAIAQQLMCSDHMLLMDEPFSGLDPKQKKVACNLISSVAALHEENTIVIVTHDIEAAVKICDQVLVIGQDPKDKVAGARIVADIDLKERGIAWRPDNEALPIFSQTVRELKALF